MVNWKSTTLKEKFLDTFVTVPVSTMNHIWCIFCILCSTIAEGVAITIGAVTGNEIPQNVRLEMYPFDPETSDWVDWYSDGIHNLLVVLHEYMLDFIDPVELEDEESEETESEDENLK